MDWKPVFIDNHVLIALKPAGLATQAHGSESNLHEAAKAWIKKTYQKPGNVFLEPVHRLDKPVSGLVLFARTSKALSRLNAQMRAKQIKKTYFALIEGNLPSTQGRLEHFLVHDEHFARLSDENDPSAKLAVLEYRFIEKQTHGNLVEIHLHTGRYHQIRAQMAACGCPILGDAKYGSGKNFQTSGIALHHGILEFFHPICNDRVVFTQKPAF